MEFVRRLLELAKINFSLKEELKNPLFLVDLLIVIFIFYWIYKLLKNTKAVRILYGLLILIAMMLASSFLNLTLLSWFLGFFLTIILIAIPVVFQPELRNALEKIGRTNLKASLLKESDSLNFIKPIIESVRIMSREKIGGIIAIQRKTGLDDYAKKGISLDANIKSELILSCFLSDSPLHDGAIIISKGKIKSAFCTLPLSESEQVASLGTRHKAALGLSEQTDAVVAVVSGKNGQVSLAIDGIISKIIDFKDLEKVLKSLF